MKSLVLSSLLGTTAGVFAAPILGGPVHYQVTRPHSLHAVIPAGSGSVSLGQVPLDFVLTDVIASGWGADGVLDVRGTLTINGVPALDLQTDYDAAIRRGHFRPAHMTTGLFVPSGATIGFAYSSMWQGGAVTVAGYVQ